MRYIILWTGGTVGHLRSMHRKKNNKRKMFCAMHGRVGLVAEEDAAGL